MIYFFNVKKYFSRLYDPDYEDYFSFDSSRINIILLIKVPFWFQGIIYFMAKLKNGDECKLYASYMSYFTYSPMKYGICMLHVYFKQGFWYCCA